MNKEEIAIRLIELYYNNIEIFKTRVMTLNDLCKRYNDILQKINELKDSDIK